VEVPRLRLDLILKDDRVARRNYVPVLKNRLCLRLICAHGSVLVSDNDTVGITSHYAIGLDEIEDNASAPSLSAKDSYQIFQLKCDTNSIVNMTS